MTIAQQAPLVSPGQSLTGEREGAVAQGEPGPGESQVLSPHVLPPQVHRGDWGVTKHCLQVSHRSARPQAHLALGTRSGG